MNSAAIRGGTAPEATLNAVLLYDDFIVAAQANGALKRSTHLLDEAMQLNVKPWRLDMLKLPPTAAEALAEAADAHLIVLALGQSEYLPAWLMNWLEQWARHRQVQDAALAVREGGPAEPLPAWAMPKLAQFAARHGLSFILDHGDRAEEGWTPFVRQRQKRETTRTPPRRHFREGGPRECDEGWGINE